MRYPFIGGHRNGQVHEIDDFDRVEIPYVDAAHSTVVDDWHAAARTFGRDTYRREKFALYVEHRNGTIDRCEWTVYVLEGHDDQYPPWWVVVGQAPDRRTAVEPVVPIGMAPWGAMPPTVPASTLFEMGASWV